jgi:hypothetical protein
MIQNQFIQDKEKIRNKTIHSNNLKQDEKLKVSSSFYIKKYLKCPKIHKNNDDLLIT